MVYILLQVVMSVFSNFSINYGRKKISLDNPTPLCYAHNV